MLNLLAQYSGGGTGGGGGPAGSQAVPVVFLLFMIILALGFAVLALFIWGSIFKKAGYSFWMGLLMFVPIANFIWLIVFAFSKWPIHQELEALRSGHHPMDRPTGGFPVGTPPMPPAR